MIALAILMAPVPTDSSAWDRGNVARIAHYAKCVAQVENVVAHAYAVSEPGSAEESRLGRKLASDHPGCLQAHGISIMSGDTVHGMVADYLLRRDALLDGAAARPSAQSSRPRAGLGRSAFFHAYARCLFELSPTKTVAVLQTSFGTDEERQTVTAFGQLLSACMPVDLSYHVNATELHVNLATVTYRSMVTAERSAS